MRDAPPMTDSSSQPGRDSAPAVQWGTFEEQAEGLAAETLPRLQYAPCYLATIRSDGWPRVHPVGVNVRRPALVVVMFPTSPKAADLRRTGKYAVHCAVEDNNGGGGEVLVTGIARDVEPTPADHERGWIAFELLVAEVLFIRSHDGKLSKRRWIAAGTGPMHGAAPGGSARSALSDGAQ